MQVPIVLFWFRRDLRLTDNAGLYHALTSGFPVLPIFLYDEDILTQLSSKQDGRVQFIHGSVTALDTQLQELQSSLLVRYGKPLEVLEELVQQYAVQAVYANHDYEPAAMKRDQEIAAFLETKGIPMHTFKDQVIFEKNEIVKEDGTPYRVFGAYKKKWLATLSDASRASYPTARFQDHFLKTVPFRSLSLEEIGFEASQTVSFPASLVPEEIIKTYDQTRDLPFLAGTSRLGLHLRFGTVSVRQLVQQALQLNAVWLGELIWREFFMMILFHFPHVEHRPFHLEYEHMPWLNNEDHFARWCAGTTGYPLVDAGMRELNATGFMHNRVRMVAASFLVKHLLIDYRWGEAYFAQKLLDYDLAANNGNWQWCAGTGCDAAPYFRVFNPEAQTKKFDKQQEYIRKWVPEVGTASYPAPLVDHALARDRALKTYKAALSTARGITSR
ncbi:cryptochrome/photolyase family protein [Rufibacter sediminis]|uniref:Deoxyribodipyrimidine photo-lyase n=1 Tax=Rufibacter sediminis TaxID=2762756 RepID=A0ABR6VWV3_9BACT|nr:deoxyribodipyrimidine photo-lyase [Rufibacter sediminis]MBC3541618.1 deoxyribodipyrimidine photo-lyase [Rufibacter sediminis]